MTNDITEFTCADFLKPGEKTPVACRMSTVTHEKGYGRALCAIVVWVQVMVFNKKKSSYF